MKSDEAMTTLSRRMEYLIGCEPTEWHLATIASPSITVVVGVIVNVGVSRS